MSKRKSLNDVLSNDRSVARAAHVSINGNDWTAPKVTWFDDAKSKGGGGGYSCHKSHPPLKFMHEGEELTIRGGSCLDPPSADEIDVLIGFDRGMNPPLRFYPWLAKTTCLFPISDMSVPTSQVDFDNLIKWTLIQLHKGKRVYCGCVGGHGRTGLFLSALICTATGNKDAISLVRGTYCHKAVESTKQIEWLHEHYGITKIAGSKSAMSGHVKKGSKGKISDDLDTTNDYRPIGRRDSVWGE